MLFPQYSKTVLQLRQVALWLLAKQSKFTDVTNFIKIHTQISTLITKIQIKLNLIAMSINQKLGTIRYKIATAKEILALIFIYEYKKII